MYKIISFAVAVSVKQLFESRVDTMFRFIHSETTPDSLKLACLMHLFQYGTQNADLKSSSARLLNWEQHPFQASYTKTTHIDEYEVDSNSYVRINFAHLEDIVACRKYVFDNAWPTQLFVRPNAIYRMEGQCRLSTLGRVVGKAKTAFLDLDSQKTKMSFLWQVVWQLKTESILGVHLSSEPKDKSCVGLQKSLIESLWLTLSKKWDKMGSRANAMSDTDKTVFLKLISSVNFKEKLIVATYPINRYMSALISSAPFSADDAPYNPVHHQNSRSLVIALNKSGAWPSRRQVWRLVSEQLLKDPIHIEKHVRSMIPVERLNERSISLTYAEGSTSGVGPFYQKVLVRFDELLKGYTAKTDCEKWVIENIKHLKATWNEQLSIESQVRLIHRLTELVLLLMDHDETLGSFRQSAGTFYTPYAMTGLNDVLEAFQLSTDHVRSVTTGRNYFEMLTAQQQHTKNRWATVTIANQLDEIEAAEWLRLLEHEIFKDNKNSKVPDYKCLMWEDSELRQEIFLKVCELFEDVKRQHYLMKRLDRVFEYYWLSYQKELAQKDNETITREEQINMESHHLSHEENRQQSLMELSELLHIYPIQLRESVKMLVTEIHPNNVTAKLQHRQHVAEWLPAYMKTREKYKQGPFCLVLDLTCNANIDPEVQAITSAAQPWLDTGQLALVILQSHTKFSQGGVDAISGGGYSVTANGAYWRSFRKRLVTDYIPNDSSSIRLFELFQRPVEDESLEQLFLSKLRATTDHFKRVFNQAAIHVPIQKEFFPLDIQFSSDRNSVVVSLDAQSFLKENYLSERLFTKSERSSFLKRLVHNVIRPIAEKRELTLSTRQSIGFPLPSINDCDSRIRLTCGAVSEDEIKKLVRLLIDVNVALDSCPDPVRLVTDLEFFDKWCQRWKNLERKVIQVKQSGREKQLGEIDGHRVMLSYNYEEDDVCITTKSMGEDGERVNVLSHYHPDSFYNLDEWELSRILLMHLTWTGHKLDLKFKPCGTNAVDPSTFHAMRQDIDFLEESSLSDSEVSKVIKNSKTGLKETFNIISCEREGGELKMTIVIERELLEETEEPALDADVSKHSPKKQTCSRAAYASNPFAVLENDLSSSSESVSSTEATDSEPEYESEEEYDQDDLLILASSIQDPVPISLCPNREELWTAIRFNLQSVFWMGDRLVLKLGD